MRKKTKSPQWLDVVLKWNGKVQMVEINPKGEIRAEKKTKRYSKISK